jgi:hypothetical protein
MSYRTWSFRRLVVAPFLCLPLALIPFADCQAPTGNAAGQTTRMPDLKVLNYDAFLRFLGNQQDPNQTAMRTGSTSAIARPDYSAAIGIDKDQEHTMLTTLLDAFREEKDMAQKWGVTAQACRLDNFGQRSDSKQIDDVVACRKARQANLQEARIKLKSEVGEGSFNKIDHYINARGWENEQPGDSNPCPGRINPVPGETHHFACAGFYEDLVRHIAWTDAENRRVAAGGEGVFDKRVGFYVPIEISDEKLQSVIALSLEADRQIKEADRQFEAANDEFVGQNVAKYGVEATRLPPPPEINALWKKSGELLEQYIAQLKEELGEESFKQVDTYLGRRNSSINRGTSVPS